MTLLAGLIAAGIFTACFQKKLKQHPRVFYIIAVFLSAVTALENYHGFPAAVEKYAAGLLERSTFATALWCQVMWAGALPDRSKARRTILPIRGELSILAAILTLGHNVRYGKNYLVKLFLYPAELLFYQRLACIITIVMLLIMVPLTILSFQPVRRRFRAKTWKKIQRLAYLFYAGIYCHVMCLYLPKIAEGESFYLWSAAVYTLLFGAYAVQRVRKWFFKRQLRAAKQASAAAGARRAANDTGQNPNAVSSGAGARNAGSRTMSGSGAAAAGVHMETETRPAAKAHTLSGAQPSAGEHVPAAGRKQKSPLFWNIGFLCAYVLLTGSILLTAFSIRGTAVSEEDGQETEQAAGAAAASCKNGIYEVQVMGYDGYLYLTVTIEDQKITDITGSSEESDLWYFRKCSKVVMSAIIEAQDTHVDAVSECTTTSKAIMKGVRKALEAAQE